MAKMTKREVALVQGEKNRSKDIINNTTLDERINMYANAWVNNGGDKLRAYADAGYSYPTYSNAKVFHEKYEKQIERVVRDAIRDKVPLALNVLQEIMIHGKSETARTKAALEILDRSGHSKDAMIASPEHQPKTREELQAELSRLLTMGDSPIKFLPSNNPEGDS